MAKWSQNGRKISSILVVFQYKISHNSMSQNTRPNEDLVLHLTYNYNNTSRKQIGESNRREVLFEPII